MYFTNKFDQLDKQAMITSQVLPYMTPLLGVPFSRAGSLSFFCSVLQCVAVRCSVAYLSLALARSHPLACHLSMTSVSCNLSLSRSRAGAHTHSPSFSCCLSPSLSREIPHGCYV